MDIKQLQNEFTKLYGTKGNFYCFHSPGRVNLIGEHTDYNGGYVFPCALSLGTYGVIRKRNDDLLMFASTDLDLKVTCSLSELQFNKEHDWANYLKGVIKEFTMLNHKLSGLEIIISGNIPNGSGLSSSASIELLVAVMINELYNCNIDRISLVKMCQHVENDYMGVASGIMDQFAVGMGKKDYAILLNCNTLEHEYIPVKLQNHTLVISNTNKKRKLSNSKYNERRAECEQAVSLLNKNITFNLLGEITPKQFEDNKYLIQDDTILKRATHIIYEIKRTLDATTELQKGNIIEFGRLMDESHISLRDLYAVSCDELDILVEEAKKIKGTIGSRMTGAGFGGCTISIVENGYVNQFIKEVATAYEKRVGYAASFYIADIGGGTQEI